MAALGVFALLVAVVYCIIRIVKHHNRVKKYIDQIQGPRAYPIIGNIHQFKREPDEFFEQAYGVSAMYSKPRMLRVWLMWQPYLIIYGPDEAEVILNSNKHINKARDYYALQPWLGLGLLTSYAQKWRPRRKLLTPTFHYDILKDYVEVYSSCAKNLVAHLSHEKEAVDIYNIISRCTLDIICETAMGIQLNALKQANSQYIDAIYRINDIIHERQKKPWLWSNWIFNTFGRGKEHDYSLSIVHGFSNQVIKDRYEALKKGKGKMENEKGKGRLAFLDLLLDMVEKGELPMSDVRDEVDTFMFEGHDTTSAGINWALHLLATNPPIQTKVQSEIDEIFGEDDRDINYDDLKDLTYLECCLKEALRLFPSVPIFGRSIESDTEIGGYRVPCGTQVIIIPYGVHRDTKHWPDPEIFKPDRFFPENTKGRHPYAYLPFSAGPRNCIGQRFALMEEKSIVAMILRYFTLESVHRRDQVRPKAELILRPCNGVHLKLTPRRPIPSSYFT